jgi:tripartite-type tricarboxylate transporter receptor subunit TctC
MTRLFAIFALSCSSALAQVYPSRPITLIIPFPPGGSTDIVGRIAADGMARELRQPVVVDNRGGAGGAIGAKAIADAAPDGYSLGVATVSTHVVNPIVHKDLRYDPLSSFTLLSQIAVVPDVLAVHPSVPAKDIQQLVDYARRNPGKLNYGTAGVGSLAHLRGESFKYFTKVDLTHVPYRGAAPALNDTLAGQVQVLFDNVPSSLPHIQSGKLRALVVGSEKRVPALPDIPTYAEAGYRLMNDATWFGLIAPAGLPAPIATRVHAALVAALKQPEVQKRLQTAAASPVGNSPEAFRKIVSDGLDKTRKVSTEAKLKFE